MINGQKLVPWCAALALACASPSVFSYNEGTHRILTDQAYMASVVAGPVLWTRLGLDLTVNTKTFPGSSGPPKIARELMQDGAEFEDKIPRSLNHFFNPLTGSGLTPCLGFCTAAPNWGLEDQASYLTQTYSYRDARQAYFQALTALLPAQRETAFGATFETLGHVVHLVQDMAQPQHVRNDEHLSILIPTLFNPSLFERRASRVASNYLAPAYPLAYRDGNTQSLVAAREFWQTGATGKGLAEFANRNFVSQGTNFTGSLSAPQPNANFPKPVVARLQTEDANAVDPLLPVGVPMDFIVTNVTDTLISGKDGENLRASTISVFDDDLLRTGFMPRFAYNVPNIEKALGFLIPRAVGYSGGMIDYFFRGDIDLIPDDLHMGKYAIVNATSEAMSGTFTLYYDAVDGNRYQVPGAQWSGMAVPAKDASTGTPGRSAPIGIRAPINAKTDGVYMLVFQGDLGQEHRDANSFGAVAGRQVKTVPLEALYIAGVTADNQVITLRVDENGTQLLSGPDESGYVKRSPAFNPLAGIALDGSGIGRKPSLMKQVIFPDGPGGLRYRVLAFTGIATSAIRDTKTLEYSTACCWQAQSADPTIGGFTFALNGGGNFGNLSYVRTYVDANGTTQTDHGYATLPPLPGYATDSLYVPFYASPYSGGFPSQRVDYKDLTLKGPVVASDGLTVYGLLTASTVSNPPLPWGASSDYSRHQTTTINVISLRIQLAATPTVSAVVDQVLTDDYQDDLHYTGIGSEYYESYSCLGSQIRVKNRTDVIAAHDSSGTGRNVIYVGAFDGDVRSYPVAGTYAYYQRTNDHAHSYYSGTDCDYDYYNDQYQHLEGQAVSSYDHVMLDGPMSVKSGNGLIHDFRLTPNPQFVDHLHCDIAYAPGYCTVSNQHDGASVTTDNPIPTTVDVRDPAIVFAPYDSAVVYNTYVDGISTPKLGFRGIDITGKDFVADASPLGEMFFALSDGTLIIHEPKAGRMPPFVKPKNMVKITAALWL